jgi:hypothetical protein
MNGITAFPTNIDNDTNLPPVFDNITQLGALAINAIRSAIFAIENNIGIGANGSQSSIAARLNVALNPDGSLSSSALLGLLSTISITNEQVSQTAAIEESKIALSYPTAALYNLIAILDNSVDLINGFISITGIKVEPHIAGTAYNHNLTAILIDSVSAEEYTNRFLTNRDTANANTLLLDINTDLSNHERADGTSPNPSYPLSSFTTVSGEVVPSNYAHAASGVYINSTNFSTIPQTETNLQNFADEVDILLGNSIQNLFENGIIRASRSTVLSGDGYAQPIVPPTPATTHLLGIPPNASRASAPVDDITIGDDVITFNPSSASLATAAFDAAFAQVKSGDILTVNYGNGIAAQFAVDSVKSIISGETRIYAVRIVGKNLYGTTNASARIDQSLFQTNKFGVLASSRTAILNNSGQNALGNNETLIVSSPKGATALGVGFNASEFDSSHYNLYLTLYPTGNPSDQVINLPAIDITGNKGSTPGAYTLAGIINSTNLAFRVPGYNYRFVAFEYDGNFGIGLADSYNDAAFSIIGTSVDGYGNALVTSGIFKNNVVDGYNVIDPLGFGSSAANVASPAYSVSYVTPIAASVAPTLIFYALRKNYYYISGTERDSLNSDPDTINNITDVFGDGYYPAVISSVSVGTTSVSTTYTLDYDLSTSGIELGKTIVVQPAFPITDSRYSYVDYGRFVVSGISFSGCDTNNPITTLTVYDAVHGTGNSPYVTSNGIPVNIYFSDDSVSFDAQNVADDSSGGPFKRFFEVYVDQNGHTFTHERARFLNLTSSLINLNFNNISPKLAGYVSSSLVGVNIQLNITSYSSTTGVFSGYLSAPGGTSNIGVTTTGQQGEVVRFYDSTNIDFIEVILPLGSSISSTPATLTIQLFPSLQLNQDFFLLSTCQLNDTTKLISNLVDQRQYGNVSENQLSDSAIDFINAYAGYSGQNGVVRGFDYIGTSANELTFSGGIALVNGSLEPINNFTIEIPIVQDYNGGTPVNGILWAICINSLGEVIGIPLTDYNSSVNSIDNPGRLLQLYNPANASFYYVDSSTFTTIVNTRKDLTVISLVVSQVTNSTTYTFTQYDARKYITDVSGNFPLVFSSDSSQGNFRSLFAMMSWAKYNSSIQTSGILRGSIVLYSDPGFISGLSLTGEGNSEVNGQFTLAVLASLAINGTNFSNVYFEVSGGITIQNAVFTGCTFNCLSQLTVGSNTTFNNCSFISNEANLATTIVISPTAQDIQFTGCSANYIPKTSTGYSSSNLINSGNAFIYSSVSSLQNISINNCTFTTNTATRFPFISFEYNDNDGYSSMQHIQIKNNQFYNTSTSDDRASVIAFNCLLTSTPPAEGLKLIDCLIEDNFCDKNQMISLTSVSSSAIVNTLIVAVGVRINRNICGTIAVTLGDAYTRNYETSTNGIANGKQTGVSVTGNTCKLIASLEGTGQLIDGLAYFSIAATAPTSPILIANNTAAWISHCCIPASATAIDQGSSAIIINNNLQAYDSVGYLSSFFSGTVATTSAYNAAISLYPLVELSSIFPTSIVDSNKISSGNYLNSSAGYTPYAYACGLVTSHSGPITNNIINGSIAGSNFGLMFCNGGDNVNIISGNFLYRYSTTIAYYISASSSSIISNNYYDQTTVDGTSVALVNGGQTTRSIAQPLILGAATSVSYNSGPYPSFNGSGGYGIFNATRIINGATLSSITITYANSTTATTAPTFGLYIYTTGGVDVIHYNATGTTGYSTSSVTINIGAIVNDASNLYCILANNPSTSSSLTIYGIVFNYTNILSTSVNNL